MLKGGSTTKCIPLPTGVTLPVDSTQEGYARGAQGFEAYRERLRRSDA